MDAKVTMVPCINAEDIPQEAEEWCIENEISMHYDSRLTQVEDDGNPFAEWLKTLGIEFPEGEFEFIWIGVFGT